MQLQVHVSDRVVAISRAQYIRREFSSDAQTDRECYMTLFSEIHNYK